MVAGTGFTMVGCGTSCSLSTRAFHTQWLTFFLLIRPRRIVTLFSISAIIVGSTSNLDARNVSIALKTGWAVTDGLMIFHLAQSSITTNSAQARVNTVLRFACFG
jgi:hypothetical protein